MAVKDELQAAQALIPQVTQSAVATDFAAVDSQLNEIAAHTSRAVTLTDDPLWQVAGKVPWVGTSVQAVTDIAAITNDAIAAARPVVATAPTLMPANLVPVDGAIPLAPLVAAAPVVHTAASEFDKLTARLAAVETDGAVDVVVGAQTKLVDAFGKIDGALSTADTVLAVAPQMLGAESPQTYVIMFQNNAELRSLGGTALSFAEVRADQGSIELVRAVPAGFGNFHLTGLPIIPEPAGLRRIRPRFLRDVYSQCDGQAEHDQCRRSRGGELEEGVRRRH